MEMTLLYEFALGVVDVARFPVKAAGWVLGVMFYLSIWGGCLVATTFVSLYNYVLGVTDHWFLAQEVGVSTTEDPFEVSTMCTPLLRSRYEHMLPVLLENDDYDPFAKMEEMVHTETVYSTGEEDRLVFHTPPSSPTNSDPCSMTACPLGWSNIYDKSSVKSESSSSICSNTSSESLNSEYPFLRDVQQAENSSFPLSIPHTELVGECNIYYHSDSLKKRMLDVDGCLYVHADVHVPPTVYLFSKGNWVEVDSIQLCTTHAGYTWQKDGRPALRPIEALQGYFDRVADNAKPCFSQTLHFPSVPKNGDMADFYTIVHFAAKIFHFNVYSDSMGIEEMFPHGRSHDEGDFLSFVLHYEQPMGVEALRC